MMATVPPCLINKAHLDFCGAACANAREATPLGRAGRCCCCCCVSCGACSVWLGSCGCVLLLLLVADAHARGQLVCQVCCAVAAVCGFQHWCGGTGVCECRSQHSAL